MSSFNISYDFWEQMVEPNGYLIELLRRFVAGDVNTLADYERVRLKRFFHGLETIQFAVEDKKIAQAKAAKAAREMEEATVLSPEGQEAQLKLFDE